MTTDAEKVREQVIDLFFEYDEAVRVKHKAIIQLAEDIESTKPMPMRMIKPIDTSMTMKQHRYLSDPLFKTVVDSLVGYIISNTKEIK